MSGRKEIAPAASTPGSAATSVKKRSRKAARWPSAPYLACGSDRRMVTVRDESKPGSCFRTRTKLRTSSPAPTSNTSASATSTTTNTARVRFPRAADPLLPPSLRESVRLVPDAVSAGTTPKIKPQTTDAPNVNASTVASMPTSSRRWIGKRSATTARRNPRPHHASSSPPNPPASERTRLSASNWRTSRPRPAPSAARTASSRWRAVARASRRLATFAQAMRSTKATAPASTKSAGRMSPVSCCRSGTTFDVHPVLKSGNICVRLAETCVISACACSTAMPGLRRPTTVSDRPRGVRDCAVNPIGSQTSTFLSRIENPDGMTPTIVKGVPCDTTGWPRMFGSPRKRRFHSRSLMTTVELPGTFSAAVKPRPIAGVHAEDRERARPRSTAPEAPLDRHCR